MSALADLGRAREVVERLAALDRGSATTGEHEAARLIAHELTQLGLAATIDEEPAHGTHWWPYGLPPFAAAVAGGLALRRATRTRRAVAAAVGLAGAASVAEDISGGPQVLRRLLPTRATSNVSARLGDPDAEHHLIVHAHHDAAHGGLTFDPRLAPLFAHGSTRSSFAAALGGPVLVAAGALTGRLAVTRAGTLLAGLSAAVFADIGLRRPVPGANDNASGVACLLLLAERWQQVPPEGVRVTLLSTGSEESWLEGMAAFARRHMSALPRGSTTVICVDSIGWEHLVLLASEGVWGALRTPSGLRDELTACAATLGIELRTDFPGAFPTDGLVARRAGFPTATLLSVDEQQRLPGYHTHRDTPDRVDYGTIREAADLICAFAARIGS